VSSEETERVLGDSIDREYSLFSLLSRPGVSHETLVSMRQKDGTDFKGEELSAEEVEQVEIAVKYAGYINRQKEEVKKLKSHDALAIPPNFDYDAIKGLSFEIREKLKKYRPETLGQASRISGVTPAAVLQILLRLRAPRPRTQKKD